MTSDLVQRVRDGADAFNRGDVEAMLSLCTDDVEIKRIDGSPDAGEAVRGREATAEWLKPVVFADQHLEILEIVEGRDVVAVRANFTATGRGSGVEIKLEAYIVYFMENGLVRRIENWRRREDAEWVSGLQFSDPG